MSLAVLLSFTDLVARIPALPTLLRILLIACLAFAASYLVVAAMQRCLLYTSRCV